MNNAERALSRGHFFCGLAGAELGVWFGNDFSKKRQGATGLARDKRLWRAGGK